MTGAPWVAEFRDPWLGNALATPRSWLYRRLQVKIERWIVRSADRVVCVTPSLTRMYQARYPGAAVITITNGYDRTEVRPRTTTVSNETFAIVYTGTLDRPIEFGVFLEGVDSLIAHRPELADRLRITFYGEVAASCMAIADRLARDGHLADVVRFAGFVPREDALAAVRDADAALVLLGSGPGMDLFVGGKLYDYLGQGVQILAMIPDGDAREVLESLGWGVVARPEPADVSRSIERLLEMPRPTGSADPSGLYDRERLAGSLATTLDEARAKSSASYHEPAMPSGTTRNVRAFMNSNQRLARLGVVAVVGFIAASTWYLASSDQLPLAAVGAIGAVALLISVRWPLISLYAFAALVPIEELLQIGEIGTLSRLAGILFMLSWAVPRIGRLVLAATPVPGWLAIAWTVLSLGWAVDASVTQLHLSTLLQLFAISVFVADVVVQQPGIVRPLMWAYSVSATVTAGIVIEQLITNAAAQGQRIAAFSDQDVAQFAAILLPALVFALFELVHGRALIVSPIVLLVTAAGIIVSGTRGAWISSIVVFVFFILPQLQARRRVAALAAAMFILLITIQLPGVADLISRRADLALRTGGAGRTDVWAVGATIFQSSPLIGVGFENFPVAYTPEVVQVSSVSSLSESGFAPHSIVVGTLAELGVIGAVAWAAYLLPLVYRRGWGDDAAMIRAALASVLIAGLFLDVLNRKQVWLLIGIAAGLLYLARKPRDVDQAAGAHVPAGFQPDTRP